MSDCTYLLWAAFTDFGVAKMQLSHQAPFEKLLEFAFIPPSKLVLQYVSQSQLTLETKSGGVRALFAAFFAIFKFSSNNNNFILSLS